MKHFKMMALAACAVFAFGFAACSSDDDSNGGEKESSEANENSFVVGSTLKISGLDYTVISNTVSGSTSRAATDNIIDASLVANERAKNYAQDIFGDNGIAYSRRGKSFCSTRTKRKI